MKKNNAVTLLLVLGIIVIVGFALVLNTKRTGDGERFIGTDTAATTQIEQDHPAYKPWFTPLFTPPSGEIESGLFAVQAALGGTVLGYTIGALRSRRRTEASDQPAVSSS
ncbi:MAG: energy-coupling factor ABC transporter substrate-binding protein [Dermatophilaceae bacterium]